MVPPNTTGLRTRTRSRAREGLRCFVAKADTEVAACRHGVAANVDPAGAAHHLLERDQPDVVSDLRDHSTGVSLREIADRRATESLCEQAIEADRRTAALQVAQHDRARLEAGRRLDAPRQPLCDAT